MQISPAFLNGAPSVNEPREDLHNPLCNWGFVVRACEMSHSFTAGVHYLFFSRSRKKEVTPRLRWCPIKKTDAKLGPVSRVECAEREGTHQRRLGALYVMYELSTFPAYYVDLWRITFPGLESGASFCVNACTKSRDQERRRKNDSPNVILRPVIRLQLPY